MNPVPPITGRHAAALAERGERENLSSLDRRRRLGMGIAFACASLILGSNWLVGPEGDWFIGWVYPVHSVALAVLVALIVRQRLSLEPIVLTGFGLVSSLALLRLVWHFATPGVADRMVDLAGGLMLGIATLIVSAFIVFDFRRGLLAGGLLLVMSLGITLVGLWNVDPTSGGFAEDLTYPLLRAHMFLVAILAMASGVAIVHDTHRRVVTRAQLLTRWATTDPLTGVANRRAGEEFLSAHLERAHREGRPVAVALLDIDHFKAINDAHGHAMGDAILTGVAERLGSSLRESDLLVRWGGEEFLVISPGAGIGPATMMAERCRSVLGAQPFEGIDVTATFGVSAYQLEDTVESIISRADRRMYVGKKSGRNCVVAEGEGADPSGERLNAHRKDQSSHRPGVEAPGEHGPGNGSRDDRPSGGGSETAPEREVTEAPTGPGESSGGATDTDLAQAGRSMGLEP